MKSTAHFMLFIVDIIVLNSLLSFYLNAIVTQVYTDDSNPD